MIGLALIEYFAGKIGGTVGQQWFYENLPIDENGAMSNYGVYVVTNSMPMERNGDFHNEIEFNIAIGEGATDPTTGQPVAEKYATDQLADKIQILIRDWLDDPARFKLTVNETNEKFTDVQIYPTNSKARTVTLSNGAIVKQIRAEVMYKKI